ncbi:MAG TPA: lipopolysaccharide biosynthesis protein [Puia sp.]|nr:lipopolysaccharide biosynthesis protein [Puia sp.]
MSTIRKQSIISSVIVYIGIALGVLINFIFARWFTPDQYGLINGMFMAIGMVLSFAASLGMPNFIMKFYPYYKDNLPVQENDMVSIAILVSLAGFIVTLVLGAVFRQQIIHFYQAKSAELVKYYWWLFPFGLGITIFSVLEPYGWHLKKSVLTSFLREVAVRVVTLLLIVLYLVGVIGSFGLFVKLYAFTFLSIAVFLGLYLLRSGELHFSFHMSRVTRKFSSKIRALALQSWVGSVFFNLSFYLAQIIIAGLVAGGLSAVGVFTLAQLASSLIQAPQRAVGAASIGPLSRAWKDKDLGRIGRIYHRSAINQLVFSVGMFVLIWINYRDGIEVFHLNPVYMSGQWVFFFIGLARVADLGTGVNSQVIGTSADWRVEVYSGIILVALTIPLNYMLAKEIGIVGPAIADLVTFSVYNAIRWLFLFRKYKLQPFDRKSGYTILLAAGSFILCHELFGRQHGIGWIFARTALFVLVYGGGVLLFQLSEDVLPVWQTIKKRVSGPGGLS